MAQKLKTDKAAALKMARSLIGAKWRHLGRKPWAIDCIGIVIVSLRAGGVFMQDRTDYGREPWNDGLEHDLHLHLNNAINLCDDPNMTRRWLHFIFH